MKLYYKFSKTDYPVNSKITLPVGIRKAKFRADGAAIIIGEIGSIGTNSINTCTSLSFPTVDDASPCEFTITYWYDTATALYINIEELGGRPSKTYFV